MNTSLSALQGAVFGQFVGDAAALGSHWIYDLDAMAEAFPGGVQGFETPAREHYHAGKKSGDQTHYGDAALLLLESVAACGGRFREDDFGMRFESFFNAPACRSYKDHATKETLEHLKQQPGNFQNGADDNQLATVSRLAPVVAAYQKDDVSTLADAIGRLTRVTQNNATAQACATASAVLLRHLLEGMPFREAFEATRKSGSVSCDTSDYFEAAHTLRHKDVTAATDHFGQSCPLPQSFPSALHAAWVHHDNFEQAILSTLRAGGDSAGRASMIGAWLGAAHGISGIPSAWVEKLSARPRIAAALDQLLAQRPGQA